MAKDKSLRILCFGDSLTYGTTNYNCDSHPYSLKLEKELSKALPDTKIYVVTDGMPGQLVSSSSFLKRMKAACQDIQYDWVIMLGGTNDLGHSRLPEDIYLALQDAWDVALRKNTNILALTVPECHARVPWLDNNRAELNDMIKKHTEPDFYHLDILPKVPYHSLSEEDCKKYWDDGLHMTPAGYDLLGGHVADALLKIISEEKQATSAKSKHPSREAELSFEEETGSSKDISQGYVVVRKKDLD